MDIKATVSIPYRNVSPTNVAVNVWSFQVPADDIEFLLGIQAYLSTFYVAINDWMSPLLNCANANIKMYRRLDAQPQAPIFDNIGSFGIDNQTNEPLPEEVAVVMSFRGPLESGQAAARRRGRVFLGPMGSQIVEPGANGRAVVAADFIDTVITATIDAEAELVGAGAHHCVWSKLDQEGYVVTDYWMDNAFDTQRRRGPDSSFRQTWIIP